MIYKVSVTLKSNGKVLETFVDKPFEISQTMCRTEWLIVEGFNGHPLRVEKTIAVRSEEVAGIEVEQADDWMIEKAKDFKDSLKAEPKTKL